jgi:hypothetical protein
MQKSNQFWETNEQETVVVLSKPMSGNATNKNGVYIGYNSPIEEDDDLDEDDQSDTIYVDENYPGPKEGDIDHKERPGINEGNQEYNNININAADSEPSEEKSDENRRSVDENGQRINWDNPEISEAGNTEDPEISDQEEDPDQPDIPLNEKEVADDASIRNLYDTNPNASTIRSSNADRTFGNEKQRKHGDEGNFDRVDGE